VSQNQIKIGYHCPALLVISLEIYRTGIIPRHAHHL